MAGTYYQAVARGQQSGQAGRVVPSGGAGNITYRFAPSGPAAGGSSITPAASSAFNKAIAQYQPGGGFGKGVKAALGRSRTKAMASGMQSLVSSGLSGTTVAAGLGKKFEEEVGMPTLAGIEEARAGNLSRLYASLAGMEQSGYESARSQPGGGGGGLGPNARRGLDVFGKPLQRSLLSSGRGRGSGGSLQKTGGSETFLAEYEAV